MIAQTLVSLFLVMAPDSLSGAMVDSLHTTQADSGLVPSPLPDPMIKVVQWIFQRPGWVMVSGIVLGAIVAVVVLSFLWKHRMDISGPGSLPGAGAPSS